MTKAMERSYANGTHALAAHMPYMAYMSPVYGPVERMSLRNIPAPSGYVPATFPGYVLTTSPGYVPAASPGYIPAASPGYVSVAPSGYVMATPPGYVPSTTSGYVPAPGYTGTPLNFFFPHYRFENNV